MSTARERRTRAAAPIGISATCMVLAGTCLHGQRWLAAAGLATLGAGAAWLARRQREQRLRWDGAKLDWTGGTVVRRTGRAAWSEVQSVRRGKASRRGYLEVHTVDGRRSGPVGPFRGARRLERELHEAKRRADRQARA